MSTLPSTKQMSLQKILQVTAIKYQLQFLKSLLSGFRKLISNNGDNHFTSSDTDLDNNLCSNFYIKTQATCVCLNTRVSTTKRV